MLLPPPLSCSVVIPCHNEEDNIAECVWRVPALGTSTEIVVVDDGSTDGTRQRVSDTLCGTKAMLRRDYMLMPRGSKERWGDFDLLFGAGRLKLRILEIPVHYQERRAGKSKMRVMRDGWLFLCACWRGWRMLRFPDSVPWTDKQEPVSGWREIGLHISEGVT